MEARGYETFDHTADIGIHAWAGEFADLFEEAAKALFNVMVDLKTVHPTAARAVQLAAESGEELMLAWLKELLFIFETERFVCSQFKVTGLTPATLSAELKGERLDPSKHVLGREVKAVTLHQFKLTQEKSRCEVRVILDI